MTSRSSKIVLRATVSVLGFVAFLLLAESALRITAFVRREKSENPDTSLEKSLARDPSLESELRIVTLGESTTAIAHVKGKRIDWPFQLNQLLLQAEPALGPYRNVRIFNFGASGTSTPILVRQLKERIDVIDPDIVIAMMGVNNATPISSREDFFYRNSRLFRFLLWGWHLGSCESCFGRTWPKATFEETPMKYRDQVNEFREKLKSYEISDQKSLAGFQEYQVELQRTYNLTPAELARELSVRYLDEVYNLRTADDVLLKEKLTELAVAEGRSSLAQNFLNTQTLHTYCLISHVARLGDCAEAVLASIKKGLVPSYALLSKAWDLGGVKIPEFRDLIRENGFYFNEKSNTYREIADAYRSVADTARWRGILFVAMQYPGGSRDGLLTYFERGSAAPFQSLREVYSYKSPPGTISLPNAYRSVLIVDNEIFNQIVSKDNATEYYLDFFARQNGMNFGHTTEKGNSVIAKNVFDSLSSKPELIEQAMKRKIGR